MSPLYKVLDTARCLFHSWSLWPSRCSPSATCSRRLWILRHPLVWHSDCIEQDLVANEFSAIRDCVLSWPVRLRNGRRSHAELEASAPFPRHPRRCCFAFTDCKKSARLLTRIAKRMTFAKLCSEIGCTTRTLLSWLRISCFGRPNLKRRCFITALTFLNGGIHGHSTLDAESKGQTYS